MTYGMTYGLIHGSNHGRTRRALVLCAVVLSLGTSGGLFSGCASVPRVQRPEMGFFEHLARLDPAHPYRSYSNTHTESGVATVRMAYLRDMASSWVWPLRH